jgi:uncharacterized protein YecT (DUF1311 family)
MRRWPVTIGLAFCAAGALADTPDCDLPLSTTEHDLCQSIALEQAQQRLDQLYQRALHRLASEPACPVSPAACRHARNALVLAQQQWTAFRDADCESAYAFHSDGSGRNAARLECLAEHTSTRQRQLRDRFEIR